MAGHSAKNIFLFYFFKWSLSSARWQGTRQRIFFFVFRSVFFVRLFNTVSNPILKFGRSLTFFAIFD